MLKKQKVYSYLQQHDDICIDEPYDNEGLAEEIQKNDPGGSLI